MQTLKTLATREEALRRLAAFVPAAGRDYANGRNYDRGPEDRANVSTLAPYIRCRLITEEEVLRAVLERFRLTSATKFVQEVFWRTYWKGWLESHPAVWHDYRAALAACIGELREDEHRSAAYGAALDGRTGIEAFDAWSRELTATGYLHNHARMWFASIWIFTLRLPWELGADFFMRNLLCGDPASNTLSWRWVAGLHTKGKTYLARRDNIRQYTQGRLDVGDRLSTSAPALQGQAYAASPLPQLQQQPESPGPALLLLHDDDTGVDTLPLGAYDIRASLGLCAADGRSPQPVAEAAVAFTHDALADALRRSPNGDAAAIHTVSEPAAAVDYLSRQADAAGVKVVLTGFAPFGPVRDALDAVRAPLADRGISLVEIGRRYDALAWPYATRGYFGLRERIPAIVRELGIAPAAG